MKKLLRIFFILATIATTSMSFADTLDRLLRNEPLTIGYTTRNTFPFSYASTSGEPRGYVVELCQRIIELVGGGKVSPQIKYLPLEPGQRVAMLANGTTDLDCSPNSENELRGAQVAFLPTIFVDETRLMVPATSKARSANDLRGKRVAVLSGSSNVQIVMKLDKEKSLNLTVVPLKSWEEVVSYLDGGNADAYLNSESFIRTRWAREGAKGQRLLPDFSEHRARGIMINSDEKKFKDAAEVALRKLVKSGEFEKIYERWFRSAIQPDGINLQIPIHNELRQWVNATKASKAP